MSYDNEFNRKVIINKIERMSFLKVQIICFDKKAEEE